MGQPKKAGPSCARTAPAQAARQPRSPMPQKALPRAWGSTTATPWAGLDVDGGEGEEEEEEELANAATSIGLSRAGGTNRFVLLLAKQNLKNLERSPGYSKLLNFLQEPTWILRASQADLDDVRNTLKATNRILLGDGLAYEQLNVSPKSPERIGNDPVTHQLVQQVRLNRNSTTSASVHRSPPSGALNPLHTTASDSGPRSVCARSVISQAGRRTFCSTISTS